MVGNADILMTMARARQDDLLREAQRDRLATIARATATAYSDRRTDLRRRDTGESLLDRLIARLKAAVAPTQPQTLNRDLAA